ncbi:MAG: hypothetical protein ABH842_01085 [Candidatus Micrarchaeota archaeon]
MYRRTVQHSSYAILPATKPNGKSRENVDLLVSKSGGSDEVLGIFVTRLVASSNRAAQSSLKKLETDGTRLSFVYDGPAPVTDERTARFNLTQYVYLVYRPVSNDAVSTFQRIREDAHQEHHVERQQQ